MYFPVGFLAPEKQALVAKGIARVHMVIDWDQQAVMCGRANAGSAEELAGTTNKSEVTCVRCLRRMLEGWPSLRDLPLPRPCPAPLGRDGFSTLDVAMVYADEVRRPQRRAGVAGVCDFCGDFVSSCGGNHHDIRLFSIGSRRRTSRKKVVYGGKTE